MARGLLDFERRKEYHSQIRRNLSFVNVDKDYGTEYKEPSHHHGVRRIGNQKSYLD